MAQQFSQQTEEILKGRFIKRVFAETAKDIDKAQSKYISGHGFSNPIFQDREFVADNNSLQYTHAKALRFVDMKTRQSKQKGKVRKKAHPIHNKIIYGNYNNIVKELSFGFTQAIKEELHGLEDV